MIDFPAHPAEVRHFVHKRLFGAAKGLIGGGFSGAVGGFLTSGRRPSPRSVVSRTRSSQIQRFGLRRPGPRAVVPRPGLRAAGQRLIPGGQTGLMVAGPAVGDGCPQGFHPNKSDYMTKAGWVPAHSKCVRNRRRNLSNGRANTRSLRRIVAWDKQDRKLGKSLKSIARGR